MTATRFTITGRHKPFEAFYAQPTDFGRADATIAPASIVLDERGWTPRRYAEAVSAYRDALAINPAYPEAHFYLAVTLEKLGRSVEAKRHWREYRELAPNGEFSDLAKEFTD